MEVYIAASDYIRVERNLGVNDIAGLPDTVHHTVTSMSDQEALAARWQWGWRRRSDYDAVFEEEEEEEILGVWGVSPDTWPAKASVAVVRYMVHATGMSVSCLRLKPQRDAKEIPTPS
jgi:hypothetical protein